MEVGDWLRRLGFEQYEAAFREQEIDFAVLPSLTAEDLKDLGVGFVGHRRKLLDAIDVLRTGTNQSARLLEAPLEVDKAAQETAERRQVTVMFSDLVGSTALSARLDPEDLREVISAYQTCVADTVRRFGGFVAKYMGDGVLIYFGYPAAHEDDAERAVLAGLAVIDAIATLTEGEPLQVRIGAATGIVVVGDVVGSGEAQERGIVGETPNLAARLQGIAEPNTVVIGEATRRLLGGLFELRELEPKELKGIAGPVKAFTVLRASSVASRFEAMQSSGMTALVGREGELELLFRCWTGAKTGDGQVVLLSGEAGIGKSRLAAALIEEISSERHIRLRYFCSPQHTDSAFYPLIGQFERAAAFAYGDSSQTKLDKLDALLAQTSTSRQDAALFAEMLSLANDGRYPSSAAPPEQSRQMTLAALGVQLDSLANSSPVLLIFEDAHWSDPTSLEALSRMVERIASLRALLIVTFRPEFEPPWKGQPHVMALALNRLGHREVDTMIDRVVGDQPLPVGVRKDIIARTDGNPLFVEEMTKAVLEAGGELHAKRIAAEIPSPAPAVPASLHASLMARLDRLGSAKGLAQVGATIGREFSHALLAAVVRKPEVELGLELDRLIRAGLLFSQGAPPYATYLFKHALVQDAAYGTLLRQPRRALHARIADTIERQFADIAESQPEVLARHCTEAALIDKAASLWGKAGLRSKERSALVEAIEQLTRALDQIGNLPSSPTLRREQIKLQAALIHPLQHVKGQAAPQTRAAAERARVLIEQAETLGEPPDDPLLLLSALDALFQTHLVAFDGDVVRKDAAQLLALAEKQGGKIQLLRGHQAMASALRLTGSFAQSLRHSELALALYDPVEHRSLATRFLQDPRVSDLISRSSSLWALGYPEAAHADAEYALSEAREIGHAGILMHAMTNICLGQVIRGNHAFAKALSDELISLAEEKGSAYWKATGMLRRGGLFALTGRASEAVGILAATIPAQRSIGVKLFFPVWLTLLAKAHAELGQFDDAWSCIGEATTAIETTKETWYEAEVHRIGGEIALMLPEPDAKKAEDCFERALSVAKAQQAKSWELRAATSLARLWRDQGSRSDARDLLAPVYDWFTEGFDTPDLRQAKALIDELAA